MDNGGPAFAARNDTCGQDGMSLRDFFAAAALTGMLAHPRDPTLFSEDASNAYEYADAMLAEREKRKESA